MRAARDIAWVGLGIVWPWVAHAQEPSGEVFSPIRLIGIAACLVGIAGVVAVRSARSRLTRATYHWLLMAVLLLFPAVAMLATVDTVVDGTRKTEACQSCHVMQPFVDDMQNEGSPSLAAAHYRNGWIARDHCYGCHVTYGVTGTLEGKRDGFRHWLLFVTGTYEEPVRYTGSFPNQNCLGCHDGTPAFARVQSHSAIRSHLVTNGMACVSCHGPPHPPPPARGEALALGVHP